MEKQVFAFALIWENGYGWVFEIVLWLGNWAREREKVKKKNQRSSRQIRIKDNFKSMNVKWEERATVKKEKKNRVQTHDKVRFHRDEIASNGLLLTTHFSHAIYATPLLFTFLLLVLRFFFFFSLFYCCFRFCLLCNRNTFGLFVACMLKALYRCTSPKEIRNEWNKHHSRKYTYSFFITMMAKDIRDMNSNWLLHTQKCTKKR